ncbi:MAG: hypothetical protein R3C13_07715 [Hyphomonas sp.]
MDTSQTDFPEDHAFDSVKQIWWHGSPRISFIYCSFTELTEVARGTNVAAQREPPAQDRGAERQTGTERPLMWDHVSGDILVVVHGPGRGREVPTGRTFFDRLRKTRPDVAAHFRFHQTGSAAPDLSAVSLVLFWLGDPLSIKYPECYAEAVAIANQARALSIPILNSPEALSHTAKAAQAAIWQHAGVPSAAAQIVRSKADVIAAVKKLDGPCILRSDVEHCQSQVTIVKDLEAARRLPVTQEFPAVALRMYDIRQEYRDAGAPVHSLYSEYHHKARAFVFRNSVRPSHLFFSNQLIVGLSNSLFAREQSSRRRMARACGYHRKLFKQLVDEDLRYFASDPPYKDVLVRAVAELGLDFAAVDYSIRPDGTPILWEANPYFHLPPGEQSVLSAERQAVRRVNESLDWFSLCIESATIRVMA